MIRFRVENPDFFLVSPLVINNSLTTYLFQLYGKLHLNIYHNCDPYSDVLWRSGKFAADLHDWFLSNYLYPHKTQQLHIGNGIIPISMTRFSINSILWFGKEMKKMRGVIPGDDEEYLSCIYPTLHGKSNCWNTNAIVSHFAFYTQRAYLDNKGILEKYGNYLNGQWKAGSIERVVYQTVVEAMKYVDNNEDQLPEAPYTQVVNKENNKLKKIIKDLYPVCIARKKHEKSREERIYILE